VAIALMEEFESLSSSEVATALGELEIVDFSRILAGPLATMLLADLGATVVKVERPGSGDDTRSWGPPYDTRGETTYFDAVNRNKESIALDLGDDADRARALELACRADVVVENFRPGVMDGFGLGWDQLHAANPRLVYCSITGFGPDAQMPGFDLLVQAVGGLMSVTGAPEGEPQKVGVALVDVVAGLFATVGILAALRHREATDEGQRVEVSLLGALLAGLVNLASGYTAAGEVPGRLGNAHPSISPYEVYPCADELLVVAVGNDRQFAALAQVLDAPQLADDERFAGNEQRVANRVALREELVARLRRRGAREWAQELTEVRVPAGVVNDLAGAFALAQRLGLDPIVQVPLPDGGSLGLPRNPIGLSLTPPSYRSAPPRLPQRESPQPSPARAPQAAETQPPEPSATSSA
jgi:crotonobetainyl-CoA:carnitine CoA-transferase CaiB-like acyl-CoA transferase